jgi:RNA-binding protein
MHMNKLTGGQARFLRALGHHLKPVVLIGKDGITTPVLAAVDEALASHELIKIKLQEGCLLGKDEAARQLAETTGAAIAQLLGRTILLYRASDKALLQLPRK